MVVRLGSDEELEDDELEEEELEEEEEEVLCEALWLDEGLELGEDETPDEEDDEDACPPQLAKAKAKLAANTKNGTFFMQFSLFQLKQFILNHLLKQGSRLSIGL